MTTWLGFDIVRYCYVVERDVFFRCPSSEKAPAAYHLGPGLVTGGSPERIQESGQMDSEETRIASGTKRWTWWQSWWHCCKLFYQSTGDVDWCMAAASKKVLSARTDPSCRCHRYPMVSMGSCTSVTETPEQWRGFDQRGENRVDQGLSDQVAFQNDTSGWSHQSSTYHQPIMIFII